MPRPATLAAQYRMHREAFALALKLGITPRAAEQRLRDQARARRRACGTRAPEPRETPDFEPTSEPMRSFDDFECGWMMRK